MKFGNCATCVFYEPNQITVEQRDDAKYKCNHPEVGGNFRVDFGCAYHTGPEATEVNVPNHCPNPTMTDANPNPIDGPCEVLIATHYKDFPWLVYALRCIRKYLTGFRAVNIVMPQHEQERFRPLHDQFDVVLHPRDEPEGTGMCNHMCEMAHADSTVRTGTKYVLHMDADCMFKIPTAPEHYFLNDKPYYLIRTWASLGYPDPRHPISKSVSDCAQWKGPTDALLGWNTEFYTMCMNTAVLPVEFYGPYRRHITELHKRDYVAHMRSLRSAWPQTCQDWTTMGAWAERFMYDRFTWINVETEPYPADRKKAYWSHGGITPDVQREIEGFLMDNPTGLD